MAKPNRGKSLRDQVRSGRTSCPICKRTAIKAIYEVELNGKKYKICKQCKAALAHGKKEEAVASL